MATPKPGQIRCPTCHRSTPPAAYCTQCGTAIPTDARVRPRGMDRDELQDRIRARRSGADPYRRGGVADGEPGYERFAPEPEDERVQRGRAPVERRPDHLAEGTGRSGVGAAGAAGPAGAVGAAGAAAGFDRGAERGDLTRDRDDWTARSEPAAYDRERETMEAHPHDPYDDTAYDDEDAYAYETWEDRDERRSGTGAFAILGFLALGVLALLGGAVLAGVFSGDPSGVADGSIAPSVAASEAPVVSAAPSVDASAVASAAPSGEPPASGEPIVFPDGFTAEAQPCLPGSAGSTGCNSNAATNGGALDIWVGFQNGTGQDVVGATIIGPEGNTVSEGTIPLGNIGCTRSCNGWTYFNFRNLTPGTYEVRVTRNGELASETSFQVT